MITDRLRRMQNDDGFSLMEIMVAILVVAIGLLGLMAVQVSSLSTIGLAKQRQTAAQLANRVMEQMRALPYGTVTGGMYCADLAAPTADPNLSAVTPVAGGSCTGRFTPAYDTSIDEALVTTSSAAQVAPLLPHVQPAAATTVGSVRYTVRSYVSRVSEVAGVDSGFWLTTIADWASPASKGRRINLAVRSQLYSPKGCLATTTHPFSGPCQSFHYTDAGAVGGSLTINSTRAGLPVLDGLDVTTASVGLQGISTRVQSEQVVSAQSTVSTSGVKLVGSGGSSLAGTTSNSSSADTDPASGVATSPTATSDVSQAGTPTLSASGGGNTLSATAAGSDSGSAYATMTAGSAGPPCADTAGAAITTQQACATARVQPDGSSGLELNLGSVAGRPMKLAEVSSVATPWRAFGGRYVTAGASRCAGAVGAGCAAAGVTRALGTATVGSLPKLFTGDKIYSSASGTPVDVSASFGSQPAPLVSVTGYTDRAASDAGIGAGAPSVGRTGTLRYWSGSAFTNVTLGTGSGSYTIPSVTADYGTTQIDVTGTVVVTATGSPATGTSPCLSAACVTKASSGGLVVQLLYTIRNGATVTGAFSVSMDLGSALAQTTYKAAPLA